MIKSVWLLLLLAVFALLSSFTNAAQHISPVDAHTLLQNNSENTFLVDVRTNAEWRWVGKAVLSRNSSHLIYESLLEFPDMSPNPMFVDNVLNQLKAVPGFDASRSTVIFMCCCGNRSVKAADVMSAYIKNTYSMLYGFSGDLDENSHRMSVNGWVHARLPWAQQ